MSDDWRIHIEIEDAGGLLHRLGQGLSSEASEFAKDLESKRLAVSRDDNEIFVYASTAEDAATALSVVQAELAALGIDATTSKVEHWLADEERWDDEPRGETWEQESLDRGFAPWEVRKECASREEAEALEKQLENGGYSVIRQSQFLFVGTASKEDAEDLAARIHGDAQPSGETVAEVLPGNPFAIFGGLGS
ncbi:MAG TPA: hypothetical protein VMJ49_04645 [Gaiellaceae bacterium]|nr:hypothetical protein [Gaiellaceae bacterium]